ncbi:TolC family protein [Microbulbifer sp. VAAF005]|uniref:TolC family protein n=1 Tax=Microbulbifer sp. VAAF005 TaxID=3034230 RepID=UPI0024AD3347|nr:TolC family protein [Microbulbifer sp. VAAF005]WHI45307.1 TolC family protein [Microbulbifer sp. VAAF005]
MKAARLGADAARYNARAVASEHLPTVTGTLAYSNFTATGEQKARTTDVSGTQFDRFPQDTKSWESSAAVTVTMPLFTGGLLSANRRQARNQAFEAQDLSILTERDTIQTTRTLHRAVVTDVSRVAAREQAVVSAKSALDATQAGYEVGTRNIVDVLLAQRTLFESQTDYANSLYDYILNSLSLKQAAGLLSPKDLQDLDMMLNPANVVSRVEETGGTSLPAPSK